MTTKTGSQAEASAYSQTDVDAIVAALAGARRTDLGPLTAAERTRIVSEAGLIGFLHIWEDAKVGSYKPPSAQKKDIERLTRAATALLNCKEMEKLAQVIGSLRPESQILIHQHEKLARSKRSTLRPQSGAAARSSRFSCCR